MQILKYFLLAIAVLFIGVFAEEKKKGDLTAYYKRTGTSFLEEVAKRDGIIKLKSGKFNLFMFDSCVL
jgi:hypothetical protein